MESTAYNFLHNGRGDTPLKWGVWVKFALSRLVKADKQIAEIDKIIAANRDEEISGSFYGKLFMILWCVTLVLALSYVIEADRRFYAADALENKNALPLGDFLVSLEQDVGMGVIFLALIFVSFGVASIIVPMVKTMLTRHIRNVNNELRCKREKLESSKEEICSAYVEKVERDYNMCMKKIYSEAKAFSERCQSDAVRPIAEYCATRFEESFNEGQRMASNRIEKVGCCFVLEVTPYQIDFWCKHNSGTYELGLDEGIGYVFDPDYFRKDPSDWVRRSPVSGEVNMGKYGGWTEIIRQIDSLLQGGSVNFGNPGYHYHQNQVVPYMKNFVFDFSERRFAKLKNYKEAIGLAMVLELILGDIIGDMFAGTDGLKLSIKRKDAFVEIFAEKPNPIFQPLTSFS